MMWDSDERLMMNELKDEVERWKLRKTSLGFLIEFFSLKKEWIIW